MGGASLLHEGTRQSDPCTTDGQGAVELVVMSSAPGGDRRLPDQAPVSDRGCSEHCGRETLFLA